MDFGKGYTFAEILYFSDSLEFNGILLQVYNLISSVSSTINHSIEEIVNSGIMLGPLPVNKYPNIRGKGAWKYYGNNQNYIKKAPSFKELRGLLLADDWSTLGPWFRRDSSSSDISGVESNYEQVRHLETMILNHTNSVPIKVTMMKLIGEGTDV